MVGGGLAGLACAAALAGAGREVTLLEWRPYVGGRAYSYEHPALGETVDSQHVVLGCCTNVVDLVTQAGIADWLRWYDWTVFLQPDGGRTWLKPGALPAPMHQAGSFLRAPMLGWRDKLAVARGMSRFLRGYPGDDVESFADWLRRTGQTERAVRHFWEPVVLATLNDSFDRCSVKYAGKVFHESMLRSAAAGRMGVPTRPLSEFFAPVARLAESFGAEVRLRASVDRISQGGNRWQVRLAGGEEITAESVVLAAGLHRTEQLLGPLRGESMDEAGLQAEALAQHFVPAPITTVHLWYDREVTELDHAALLDTRVQWMFHKSRIRGWEAGRGSYLELVISGSHRELKATRETILRDAIRELEIFFPQARTARLLKSGVLKEAQATFSVTPKLDRWRPGASTRWKGVYLAGDWTRTGWPSTMEGAVRSGRLAAGELMGHRDRFLSAELPATGLMRWLSRPPDVLS